MKVALRFSTLVRAIALAAFFGASSVASAAMMTYEFTNITGNNAVDAAAGEAQLRVDVIEFSPTQVKFKFYHVGTTPMSITQIYFDDGSLLGISSVDDHSTGVSFSVGASPPDLPGGNAVDFNTTSFFLASSDPAVQPNGVNPGDPSEWLVVLFNLQVGKSYTDVIAAINLSLASPGVDVTDGLRIGVHVQGFDGGGSESFVNGEGFDPSTLPNVPEPGTMAMWALGLALCGSAHMWRKRRSNAV